VKITREQIAEGALNAACAFIQESLDIETGDLAAQFFCGENGETVERLFREYIDEELAFDWASSKCRNGLPIEECKCC
jgi:hypothetical protein